MKTILNRFYFYKAKLNTVLYTKIFKHNVKDIKRKQQDKLSKTYEKSCKYDCNYSYSSFYDAISFFEHYRNVEGYEEKLKQLNETLEIKDSYYVELKVLQAEYLILHYYKNGDYHNLKNVFNLKFETIDKMLLNKRINSIDSRVSKEVLGSIMSMYQIMFFVLCEEKASRSTILRFLQNWENGFQLCFDEASLLSNTKPKNIVKIKRRLLFYKMHRMYGNFIYLLEEYIENDYQYDEDLVKVYDEILDLCVKNIYTIDMDFIQLFLNISNLQMDYSFKTEGMMDTLKLADSVVHQYNVLNKSKLSYNVGVFQIYNSLKNGINEVELQTLVSLFQNLNRSKLSILRAIMVKTKDDLSTYKYYTNVEEVNNLTSEKGNIKFRKAEENNRETFNRLNLVFNNFDRDSKFNDENGMYKMAFYQDGSSKLMETLNANDSCSVEFSTNTFCKNMIDEINLHKKEFKNNYLNPQNPYVNKAVLLKTIYVDESNKPTNLDINLFNELIQNLEKLINFVDNDLSLGSEVVKNTIHRNVFPLSYLFKDSKYKEEKEANFYKADFAKLNFDKEYCDINFGYSIKKIYLNKKNKNCAELKKVYSSKGIICDEY